MAESWHTYLNTSDRGQHIPCQPLSNLPHFRLHQILLERYWPSVVGLACITGVIALLGLLVPAWGKRLTGRSAVSITPTIKARLAPNRIVAPMNSPMPLLMLNIDRNSSKQTAPAMAPNSPPATNTTDMNAISKTMCLESFLIRAIFLVLSFSLSLLVFCPAYLCGILWSKI